MFLDYIKNEQYEQAYEEFLKLHPHDQSILFNQLEDEVKTQLIKYLTDNELSVILTYLDPTDSAEIIQDLSLTRQKEVIDNMDIDDAVDIIDELEDQDQTAILDALDDTNQYEMLLNYDEHEAGSIMTPHFVKIEADVDVKDAMRDLIKKAPDVESISTLFVVSNKVYLGTISLNKLIKTKSPYNVNGLITHTPTIYDTDDINMAIHQMREYGLYEIAVVNKENEIIGIITLDDAIERYQDESTKDFANLSAVSDYSDKGLFKAALHRLPWLIILLLASIPIAMSSAVFEDILLSVSLLALFQPLILDASGDVATQTLAVTLRKLNQTDGASIKDGTIEIITGAINGVILGIAAGLITFGMAYILGMSSSPLMVSLVVGLSLFLTVVIGPILGFIIPVFLNKIKLDPAVASGPFITTLVDIISLVIYFGLATLLLGGI